MKTQVIALLVTGSLMLGNCSSNKQPEQTVSIVPGSMINKQVETAPADSVESGLVLGDEGLEDFTPAPTQALEGVNLPPESTAQFLQKHNLSSVWLGTIHSEEASASIFNGFYGSDRYRIEMYFASVEKDSRQSHVYHVTGKSRFKENIVPFAGKIIIDSVSYIQDPELDQATIENAGFNEVFLARGRFELKEDAAYKGSGIFAGDIFIDLGTRKYEESYEENEIDTWTTFYKELSNESGVQLVGTSRGAGFLLEGNWISYATNKAKPILVAKDIFLISNNILENFMIGERDVVINPKYRKLGWDNYWSNEEWWNEPKPIL
jgi:hypothetical protein